MQRSCPICISYMLSHPALKGWTKCVTCGYCMDKDGKNKQYSNGYDKGEQNERTKECTEADDKKPSRNGR